METISIVRNRKIFSPILFFAGMAEPEAAVEEIRSIEKRKDKYTHNVLEKGDIVVGINKEKYEVEEVIYYGEYGDVYNVTSSKGKHQMRSEIIRTPKGYVTFPTIALLIEDVMTCRTVKFKKHFLTAEACCSDRLFKYLITQRVGRTLAEIRRTHVKANFPLGDALNLAIQTYFAIEYLHCLGYVHGDLTLSSFSLGKGRSQDSNVYLTQFGRLRKHITKGGEAVITARKRVPFMGHNLVYASRSAHKRMDFGRKDDLESWMYLSADLFDDSCPPWKPRRKKDLAAEEELLRKKELFFSGNKDTLDVYFQYYPLEFAFLVQYLDSLEYESKPETELFRKAFADAKARIGAAEEEKWSNHWAHTYPTPKRPQVASGGKKKTKTKEKAKKEKKREATIEEEKKQQKMPRKKKSAPSEEEGEETSERKFIKKTVVKKIDSRFLSSIETVDDVSTEGSKEKDTEQEKKPKEEMPPAKKMSKENEKDDVKKTGPKKKGDMIADTPSDERDGKAALKKPSKENVKKVGSKEVDEKVVLKKPSKEKEKKMGSRERVEKAAVKKPSKGREKKVGSKEKIVPTTKKEAQPAPKPIEKPDGEKLEYMTKEDIVTAVEAEEDSEEDEEKSPTQSKSSDSEMETPKADAAPPYGVSFAWKVKWN